MDQPQHASVNRIAADMLLGRPDKDPLTKEQPGNPSQELMVIFKNQNLD